MTPATHPMSDLITSIKQCSECDICPQPTKSPVAGRGNPDADWMIVSKMPGRVENRVGRPHSGESGRMLQAFLKLAKIPESDIWFTNLVKGYRGTNVAGTEQPATKAQTLACAPWLLAEIELVDPKFIIVVSAPALKFFLPTQRIDEAHGQIFQWEGRLIIPMYEPMQVIHQSRLKKVMDEDWISIGERVGSYYGRQDWTLNYELVNSQEKLDAFYKVLDGTPLSEVIALDFETTDLRTHLAGVVGTAIGIRDKGWYIPNSFRNIYSLSRIWDRAGIMVAHNAKYELGILYHHGIKPKSIIHCTLALAAILGIPIGSRGLKGLIQQLAGQTMTSIEELIGPPGKDQLNMSDVPDEETAPYAAADAYWERWLWDKLSSRMTEDDWFVYDSIEQPLLWPVAKMEHRGIALSDSAITKAERGLEPLIEGVRNELRNRFEDAEYNPGSSQQTLRHLRQQHINAKSTNAKVLTRLLARHPWLQDIIEYRHLVKLQGSYIRKLREMGARAYGSINPSGTGTGRFSYSGWGIQGNRWGINLQTIPKPKVWEEADSADSNLVRACFIADPQMMLVEFDYSQIELRVLAHRAQDEMMMAAYWRGEDIHEEMIEQAGLRSVMPNADEEAIRRIAKILNFGLAYEPDDDSATYVLIRTCAEARVELDWKQARGLVLAKRRATRGVTAYYDEIAQIIKRQGYVETEMGRRLYLSWSGNTYQFQKTLRDGVNLNPDTSVTLAVSLPQ